MSMTLDNLDFRKLLPVFMQEDQANKGLARAMDQLVPDLARAVRIMSTWDHIDDLTEAELDALAWELSIYWYDRTASVAIKRDLIRNSDKVHHKLGTAWAVESVAEAFFGKVQVQEWYEYGGEPGHFQVVSNNPALKGDRFTEFEAVIAKVKRASAHFDGVIVALAGELQLCAGAAVHEATFERHEVL